MPKFAANLTMMFKEVSFLDRFERAAAAGFTAVEFLFPYDFNDDMRTRLERHDLSLVLHNLPPGTGTPVNVESPVSPVAATSSRGVAHGRRVCRIAWLPA